MLESAERLLLVVLLVSLKSSSSSSARVSSIILLRLAMVRVPVPLPLARVSPSVDLVMPLDKGNPLLPLSLGALCFVILSSVSNR
jgi:hypothetical protein